MEIYNGMDKNAKAKMKKTKRRGKRECVDGKEGKKGQRWHLHKAKEKRQDTR
jgi:hypothetical protein